MKGPNHRLLSFALVAAALAAGISLLILWKMEAPRGEVRTSGRMVLAAPVAPTPLESVEPAEDNDREISSQATLPQPQAETVPIYPPAPPAPVTVSPFDGPGREPIMQEDERYRSLNGTARAEATRVNPPITRKPGEH